MSCNEIECLKRKIKRIYERFTEKRQDEKATLLQVVQFFNISIDESRLEDYTIKKFNYKPPMIEIIDVRNEIFYMATYTGEAKLLNYSGAQRFNHVIITNLDKKEEVFYDIGGKKPLITNLSFTNGGNELVFEREMPHFVGQLGNDGIKMSVKFLQNIDYGVGTIQKRLFHRIYKKWDRESFEKVYQQLYTYESGNFGKCDTNQDKDVYVRSNNIIYRINQLSQRGLCKTLCGVCFESTDVSVSNYLPFQMSSYALLNKDSVSSAMIFRGLTEDEIRHSLQIYKEDSTTKILYYAESRCYPEVYYSEPITDLEYDLPNVTDGTISHEEIQNVIASLQEKLGGTVFIRIISEELSTFGKKIDVRKGLIQEELDLLSPKLLIDKSFVEIGAFVSANKNEYFELISKQLVGELNMNTMEERGKTKVLEQKG